MINDFRGDYKFLSNFYLSPVVFEDMTYRSVEHAYQAAKTTNLVIRRGFLPVYSPGSAKRIGNCIPLRPDWENIKIDVMRACLKDKFPLFPAMVSGNLSHKLMETHPHELVEGNAWHDNFWGVCRCVGCVGAVPSEQLNWLGKLLMERRTELLNYPRR